MASESTYAQISALLPAIWERVLMYARHNFIMPSLVTVFNDRQGMVPRSVSEYGETGMATNLGETEVLPRYELVRDLLSTLTPTEIGKQYYITDRRMETDDADVISDAISQLGYAAGRNFEETLLGLFSSLTRSAVGSKSAAFSMDTIIEARAVMNASAIPGGQNLVIHPYQYLDIAKNLTNYQYTPVDSLREQVARTYEVVNIAGNTIYVSSLVPRFHTGRVTSVEVSGSPTGGTFDVTFHQSDVGEPGVGSTKTITLAYNASAGDFQTALRALERSNTVKDGLIGVSDATVAFNTDTWTITWGANLRAFMTVTVDVSSLTGGSPVGAVTTDTAGTIWAQAAYFNPQAFALDMRRGIRIEPDRLPDYRATTLNLSSIYGAGTWRPTYGIPMVSDATAPNGES